MPRSPRPRGRPPADESFTHMDADPDDDPNFNLTPPVRVWIEGEWVVPPRSGRERVLKDQLRALLQQIPELTMYEQTLMDEQDTSRRRRNLDIAKLGRIEVVQYLQDYPGAMLQDIVKHFYSRVSVKDAPSAIARVRAMLHRLVKKEHQLVEHAGCYYPRSKVVQTEDDKRMVVLARELIKTHSTMDVPNDFWGRVAEMAVRILATATTVRTYISPDEFRAMLTATYGDDISKFARRIYRSDAQVQRLMEDGVHGAREVDMVLSIVAQPTLSVVNTLVNSRRFEYAPERDSRGAPDSTVFETIHDVAPTPPVTDDELFNAFPALKNK